MTILEICAVSALAVDVIRLIIDILKYKTIKKTDRPSSSLSGRFV